MRPTYFASFLLGEKSTSEPVTIDTALEAISEWIFQSPYRPLERPNQWPHDISEPIVFPGGERVIVQRLSQGNALRAFGVRLEHRDSSDSSRIWRTDCVIDQIEDSEKATRFSVSVTAGNIANIFSPVSAPSSRPRIVRTVIERFGARDTFPLKPTFVNIETVDVERFASFLLSPFRTLPVVFVSRNNTDESAPCDIKLLADKLIGIAYVCIAADSSVSRELATHIDNRLNAYDGGIRIYWPKMAPSDSPYRHRLWTPMRISAIKAANKSIYDLILATVSSASVIRHVPGIARWEDIERESARQALQSGQVSADWFKQYEEDLAALDALKKEAEETAEALRAKDEEVRQWKQMYLQILQTKLDPQDVPNDDDSLIEDVSNAIDVAALKFRDRLAFVEGRVQKNSNEFEEPELFYAALSWLATVYWNAKAGKASCSDFDKSCRETCQFRYAAHQSEVTMGMFSSDYEVVWNKKKVKLKEHLGYGTSPEPRHTIRIAFFFDENIEKVVIGYVGQHQATRKSN